MITSDEEAEAAADRLRQNRGKPLTPELEELGHDLAAWAQFSFARTMTIVSDLAGRRN